MNINDFGRKESTFFRVLILRFCRIAERSYASATYVWRQVGRRNPQRSLPPGEKGVSENNSIKPVISVVASWD